MPLRRDLTIRANPEYELIVADRLEPVERERFVERAGDDVYGVIRARRDPAARTSPPAGTSPSCFSPSGTPGAYLAPPRGSRRRRDRPADPRRRPRGRARRCLRRRSGCCRCPLDARRPRIRIEPDRSALGGGAAVRPGASRSAARGPRLSPVRLRSQAPHSDRLQGGGEHRHVSRGFRGRGSAPRTRAILACAAARLPGRRVARMAIARSATQRLDRRRGSFKLYVSPGWRELPEAFRSRPRGCFRGARRGGSQARCHPGRPLPAGQARRLLRRPCGSTRGRRTACRPLQGVERPRGSVHRGGASDGLLSWGDRPCSRNGARKLEGMGDAPPGPAPVRRPRRSGQRRRALAIRTGADSPGRGRPGILVAAVRAASQTARSA